MMLKIKAKDFISIPNILSYFRIILCLLFVLIYQRDVEYKSLYLGTILICSGLSDMLDGYIARKYNMITELGKCLDPIADKLTQLILFICLLSKYKIAKVILIIFLIKEISVTIVGFKVICELGKNDGAKWYGKLSTVIFYVVTVVLVIFTEINSIFANILLGISGIAIIGAFIGYMRQYIVILKDNRDEA